MDSLADGNRGLARSTTALTLHPNRRVHRETLIGALGALQVEAQEPPGLALALFSAAAWACATALDTGGW